MVSSALDLELGELLDALETIRMTYPGTGDADYEALRSTLPRAWPL